MKKLLIKLKQNEYSFLALAFFIPLTIMWLIYISLNVYPFGDNSVLVLDLNGQYVYYFEALRDIIRNGGSLLYSWSRALGGEFMGIFAYYLASPFSIIVALFPKRMITEALLTIILFKTGSCGLTIGYYLYKSNPNSNKNKILIISTMYAVSSYTVVQANNTMWIDGLIYLPLVILGIEQLIYKGKFKLFIVSLSLCLMANYYIGYMICIFVAIYFIYWYFAKNDGYSNNFYSEKKHFIKSLVRIIAASAIAVSISAWILYPAYYSLTFGKTTFSNPSFDPAQKFDYLDMIVKFFIGSYDTVRPEGLPFVYCGILTLILCPMYFISKRAKAREKMLGAVILLILILSFNTTTLDLIWHGMQRPNWLNYRYSFILIFMMLVFSFKVLDEFEIVNFRNVVAVSAFLVLILFIIQKQNYSFISDFNCIWASLICIGVLILALHPVRYQYLENGGVLILTIVVCVELFSAGLLNAVALDKDVVMSSRTSYLSYIDKLTPIINKVKESDTSFYRMEKTTHRKTNDPFAFGFYGLSNSTSTLNASQINLLNKFGYSSQSHWSKYLGSTPASDSLLGLKYIIYERLNPNDFYELYEQDPEKSLFAYYNPYALPIAYGVDDKTQNLIVDNYESPFEFMNALVTSMLGKNETVMLFQPIEVSSVKTENLAKSYTTGHDKYTSTKDGELSTISYNMTAPTDETIYAYFPSDYPREADISINGVQKGAIFGNETDRIIELGKYGTKIEVMVMLTKDELYLSNQTKNYFYYLDEGIFREVMTELQKCGMVVTEHSDIRLYGTVDINNRRTTLFTTIPYDEGWHVKIDGIEQKIIKTADSLLAVEITEGPHKVEFKYMPKCFVNGVIISSFGVALFIAAIVSDNSIRKKRQKEYAALININKD